MTYFVTRTCTEYKYDEQQGLTISVETKELDEYRDSYAYVLLGEPGMGKTISFEEEKKQLGSEAEYVTARDLITFDTKEEWLGKTLFIDGLDEVRAGTQDMRSPFDAIRKCLDNLGRPKFRLSCREADWLENDKEQLQKIVPEGETILELHLNRLTEDDVNEILIKNYKDKVAAPNDFIEQADNRSLDELIKNPQILDMLVSAITGSKEWPDSRQKTFELACRKILFTEHNQEHTDADQDQEQAIDKQLEAAGYLCALLLFSDKSGFSRTPVSATDNFLCTNELEYEDVKLLNTVSRTKLFNTINHEHFTYVHRTVAEYLSAYYLKKQIEEKGLPVGRVLALLTGKDGNAVTALRGLFACLVTMLERERSMLIKRDPLGLVLYGDVKSFTVADKTKILDALKEEAIRYPYFRSGNWVEYPFGALCTIDMEPVFSEVLKSSDRSDEQQAIVDCVLDAMMHGDCLTTLINYLPEFIRDTSWWSGVRRQALHVFIKHIKDEPEGNEQLRKLLDEINDNTIQDMDDDLLGVLLKELYPKVIKPSEIFDYFHAPKNDRYFGGYWNFWSRGLENYSSNEMVYQLLNELAERKKKIGDITKALPFRSMVGSLIERGLDVYGETIDVEILSDWLSLGLEKRGYSFLNISTDLDKIRNWISDHPNTQKEIIELHQTDCLEKEDFDRCMRKAKSRFYNADLPIDYGLWSLEKAKKSEENRVSRYFTHEAIRMMYGKNKEGLSLELFEQVSEETLRLKPWIDEMLITPIDYEEAKFNLESKKQREKEEQEKRKYIKYVKDNIDAICAGTADLGILHSLGMAYFGNYIDFDGETPHERLNDYFQDENLVGSILAGFQKCLARNDIPTVKDILKLSMQDKLYHLSFPVRAGLQEIYKTNNKELILLPEDVIRKGLVFYLVNGIDDDADWYMYLVKECSELVSESYIEYVASAIRAGKAHISHIYSLAYDEKYCKIACYVCIPLLESFPVRCSNRQLESLEYLLKAALQYAEHEQFSKLIEKKLKFRSMNIAQHAYWLGAAFIFLPLKYEDLVKEYFRRNVQRIKYLAQFLIHRGEQNSLMDEFPESSFSVLIKLFGYYYPPRKCESGRGLVTFEMNIADLVNKMIDKLSNIVSDSNVQEITGLVNDDRLTHWHRVLKGALYELQANKREADFSHPDIKQVSSTLNNNAPANVADLAVLVFDHIRDLADQIRNSDTDDYKQYWNMDYKNHRHTFIKRKHEDVCRDAFLSDLKERLSTLGVDAIPEGHYADDKRADIRVSYGGTDMFNVPIEIKCNDHKNLWYAIHDQLIAKYTRDPRAHGYGIYLVFWFGSEGTPPPPEGSRPKTAKELEVRLKERLNTKEERQQISICVIDCSLPD
ncbi:MAG: hypothetical protein O7D86_08345 [Proteobacteria bacterium]|nr:hypothetical protein [Pseudomonadota bacterium]